MSVYTYRPRTNDFDSLNLVDPDQIEVLQRFEGRPLREGWAPLALKVVLPDGQRARRHTDFPSLLQMAPVFSERAWRILEPLIGSRVEALPVLCADTGPLFIINVLDVLTGALDLDASDIFRFSSGRIGWIDRHVLHRRSVAEHPFFKLAEAPLGEVLVSDEFRRVVEKNELEGLAFPEVTLVG